MSDQLSKTVLAFQPVEAAKQPSCIAPLLRLVGGKETEIIQRSTLTVLQRFDTESIATALLDRYAKLTPTVRLLAVDTLIRRKDWALAFLQHVDAGRIPAKDIPVEALRSVALHKDDKLNELVRKHWGNVRSSTPEEKLAEVRRFNNDLRAGSGHSLVGRALFKKHCATCHRLFDDGEAVGPDLTHANRKDRDYLLVSIVDPSALIRKEYLSYHLQTTDGRVLTGLIAEQTRSAVTLLDGKNQRTPIPREKIESLRESPVSLMPENLLKELQPQELRDLFSYLQSDKPPAGRD